MQSSKGWSIKVRINGWWWRFSFPCLLFQPASHKLCLYKPVCSVLRGSGCLSASGRLSPTCGSSLCSQGSSRWQSQGSQLLWSDTSEGNPGSVLQGSCQLQPGLTRAVHQCVSAAHPLGWAGQLGKDSRTAAPSARNGQREQWGFLIPTSSLSQKRD